MHIIFGSAGIGQRYVGGVPVKRAAKSFCDYGFSRGMCLPERVQCCSQGCMLQTWENYTLLTYRCSALQGIESGAEIASSAGALRFILGRMGARLILGVVY